MATQESVIAEGEVDFRCPTFAAGADEPEALASQELPGKSEVCCAPSGGGSCCGGSAVSAVGACSTRGGRTAGAVGRADRLAMN